jgi:ribonuclease G
MTRQNVTDGPREILTRKCVVCGGDGVVLSEASAAVDTERRLRELLATAPRTKAFKVEVNAKVASILIGPGASRLATIEEETRRRFLIVPRDDVPTDHFEVLGKGTLESLASKGPVEEGAQLELKLVEVGLYDVNAGVGRLDGLTVVVGNASGLVGKKAKVRIERVLNGTAYATLRAGAAKSDGPITAESEAEKPTRKPPAKKGKAQPDAVAETEEPQPELELEEEPEPEAEADVEAVAEPEAPEPAAKAEPEAKAETPAKPRKKTRRGSRGGRRRRKPAAAAAAAGAGNGAAPQEQGEDGQSPRIHLPDPQLGREEDAEEAARVEAETEPAQDGAEQPKPKKKTRRGSRGGRNRRRKPASKSPSAPSD